MSDVGSVEVDVEFEALLAKLKPVLEATAKAAITEAVAAVPVPAKRPGSVTGVDPVNRTATVLVDGDVNAIVADCIIELPGFADRVMVEFNPSGAVFVVGNQSSFGVPPGTLAPYAGAITAHAGAASTSATPGQPPRGWLWCAGQAVSRSTYAALYDAIGTTHGTGDGATTFNVPDFRGRVFIGLDNMGGSDAGRLAASNTLGGTGGQTAVVAHTHDLSSHTHSTPSHSHGAGSLAVSSHDHSTPNHQHGFGTSSDGSHTHSYTIQDGGEGASAGVDIGVARDDTTGSTTGSDGSHSHSGTTNNDGSGTTGSASPSVSGSTSTDGSGTSGSPSNNTSGSTGSGTEQLPPYMLVHILIKA
jgi:microcystin-dependent protein